MDTLSKVSPAKQCLETVPCSGYIVVYGQKYLWNKISTALLRYLHQIPQLLRSAWIEEQVNDRRTFRDFGVVLLIGSGSLGVLAFRADLAILW